MKEIKLYRVITNSSLFGEDGYIENLTQQITDAGDEDILLRINSPGGSVDDGIAIISHLNDHKGKINMLVEGRAASMAAGLLPYADNSKATEFSKIMLHQASSSSNSEEMKTLVSQINNDFYNMYVKRGVDSKLMSDIFLSDKKKDYWFTATQARDLKIIDEVVPQNVRVAAENENVIEEYYSVFGNSNDKIIYNKDEVNNMFDSKEKKELEDKLTALQEEMTTTSNALTEATEAKVTLQTEKDKLDSEIAKLNQEAGAKEKIKAEAGDVVAKAIEALQAENKTLAESVKANDEAVAKVTKDFDELVAKLEEMVTDFKVKETQNGASSNTMKGFNAELNEINAKGK
jgi:ATP-dependent protease ClpP protease subunit